MALMAPRTPQDLPKGVQKGSKRGPKQVISRHLEVSQTSDLEIQTLKWTILRSIPRHFDVNIRLDATEIAQQTVPEL